MNKTEFSKNDLGRDIKIPRKSGLLSEFFGVLSGDGYLLERGRIHRIGIVLNLNEDIKYATYVIDLIRKLFNLAPTIKVRNDINTYEIIINSKAISKFMSFQVFPNRIKKGKIKIPSWISKDKKMFYKFLRGLMDTDGSLFFAKRGTYKKNQYPVIEIKLSDKSFMEEISKILKTLNFSHVFRIYKNEYKIQINGKEKLEKWIKDIGFKNFNHISRYLIWKRFSYCPPRTNLKERMEILKYAGMADQLCARFPERKGEPAERDRGVQLPFPAS